MFRRWLIRLSSTHRIASIRSQMRSYGLSKRIRQGANSSKAHTASREGVRL